MSRKPQTCADCARRKIKCSKTIPCDNCQKRGCAHLCRLADVTHSVDRRRPSSSASPGAPASRAANGDSSINEKILSLVTTLSERVQQLESKLDDSRPPKRSAPVETSIDPPFRQPDSDRQHERPSKQARTNHAPDRQASPNATEIDATTEREPSTGHHGSDAEAEDAATVLEFLAWGRLKDSNLTQDLNLRPDTDIIQSAQAWASSPTSVPGGSISMETLQISQVQEMLPNKEQMFLLVEYHADWLLLMHCAFHAPSLKTELGRFYDEDQGLINMTSVGLQWTDSQVLERPVKFEASSISIDHRDIFQTRIDMKAALLFAIICGSMTCAKPATVLKWGFRGEEQSVLAKRWYQASIECLNAARYQQYHNIYSVQTIASSTICAHFLGFSNSQSVLLASAVRIAQSLGLHRLGKPKRTHRGQGENSISDLIQEELGRRLWQQLTMQDWFSVPFSETYCVNPLHFSTKQPSHCDEDTMQEIAPSDPAITTYGNFLFKVASLMPSLQDKLLETRILRAKYEHVLRFDKMMRELVLSQLPSCLNSQTQLDVSWPRWVILARRCLTITCAHKILMIHRRFLGLSFHDKKYAFTRRTCLAAAKTIINEMKQDLPDESPILWTTQAFSTAAAIILVLDNFNRHESSDESEEHRQLVSDTISILSKSVEISSIASRGMHLLTELLIEEQQYFQSKHSDPSQGDKERMPNPEVAHRSLNVAAFVKKFCESDLPAPVSPIMTSQMPLWLQQEDVFQQYATHNHMGQEHFPLDQGVGPYSNQWHHRNASSSYINNENRHVRPDGHRHREPLMDPFSQNITEAFDIRSMNWMDDLLGMVPSHSL